MQVSVILAEDDLIPERSEMILAARLDGNVTGRSWCLEYKTLLHVKRDCACRESKRSVHELSDEMEKLRCLRDTY